MGKSTQQKELLTDRIIRCKFEWDIQLWRPGNCVVIEKYYYHRKLTWPHN